MGGEEFGIRLEWGGRRLFMCSIFHFNFSNWLEYYNNVSYRFAPSPERKKIIMFWRKMQKLYGQFTDQKCTKTHVRRCRSSKIFRARNPGPPHPGKAASNGGRRRGEGRRGGKGGEGQVGRTHNVGDRLTSMLSS
jgi:hypothetical protein